MICSHLLKEVMLEITFQLNKAFLQEEVIGYIAINYSRIANIAKQNVDKMLDILLML